ncbi:MAG: hypothetical protein AAFZ38_11745 [Myxococcota bacterium]
MKREVLVLVPAVLALCSQNVHACGLFKLRDHTRERDVGFYALSVKTRFGGKNRYQAALRIGDATEPLGWQKLSAATPILETVQSREYRFKGDKLFHRDAVFGELDGDSLRLGEQSYTIVMSLLPAGSERSGSKRSPAWRVAVTTNGRKTLSGEAERICANREIALTDIEKRELVRRRIVLYLAWRQHYLSSMN